VGAMTSQSYEKPEWRQRNWEWIRSIKPLWNGRKLRYRYMEFIGDTGHLMFQLMRRALPRPDFSVGVDRDAVILCRHLEEKRPFPLAFGDMGLVAVAMAGGREIDPEKIPPAPLGIVNFDTTNGLNDTWWERYGERGRTDRGVLWNLMHNQSENRRPLALILNHDLDRGGETGMSIPELVRRHIAKLVDTFDDWGLTVEHFRGFDVVCEPRFMGVAGGLEVYRSSSRSNRMLTVRLAFTNGRVAVYRPT